MLKSAEPTSFNKLQYTITNQQFSGRVKHSYTAHWISNLVYVKVLVEGAGDTETGPKGLIQGVSTCAIVVLVN